MSSIVWDSNSSPLERVPDTVNTRARLLLLMVNKNRYVLAIGTV